MFTSKFSFLRKHEKDPLLLCCDVDRKDESRLAIIGRPRELLGDVSSNFPCSCVRLFFYCDLSNCNSCPDISDDRILGVCKRRVTIANRSPCVRNCPLFDDVFLLARFELSSD